MFGDFGGILNTQLNVTNVPSKLGKLLVGLLQFFSYALIYQIYYNLRLMDRMSYELYRS